jgi:hypothetical protein
LRPDLREELIRGTDQYKRLVHANAAIFLKSGLFGGPVPFYALVDIECETDYECKAAEWFKHREALYAHLESSDAFADKVHEPGSDIDPDLSFRKSREEAAVKNLLRTGADGNLVRPTENDVDRYVGALTALENAIKNRDFTLYMNGWATLERRNWWLRVVSVVSGILYLAGWTLSFFGLLYGPAGTGPKREQ